MATTSTVSKTQAAAFAFGHVFNDLCSAMWFTYLLNFLTEVLQIHKTLAGALILIGQVVDGICTPLVGYEADQKIPIFTWMLRYGPRKSYHLIGTILVLCSFPFVFVDCCDVLQCQPNSSETWQRARFIYYIPFIVLFQMGWACVQISHLAIIPQLARTTHDRSLLNGVRFGCTVLANLAVYGLFLAVVETKHSGHESSHHHDLTPDDRSTFTILAIALTSAGIVCSAVFHLVIKETTTADETTIKDREAEFNSSCSEAASRKWSDWFKHAPFYRIAALYMFSRLYGNVSQSYIVYYIVKTQDMSRFAIALVPMVLYLSSFAVSLALSLKSLQGLVKHRVFTYWIGIAVGVAACGWMWEESMRDQIYAVAILIGAASSLVVVTSLSMTADMIGEQHRDTAAFVYGVISFCDKISSGLTIQIVESMADRLISGCEGSTMCEKKAHFYRYVIVTVPGIALVLAGILLLVTSNRFFADMDDASTDCSDRPRALSDITWQDSLSNRPIERSLSIRRRSETYDSNDNPAEQVCDVDVTQLCMGEDVPGDEVENVKVDDVVRNKHKHGITA